MSHHPDGSTSRVRQVPIHVEQRDETNGDGARYGNQYHQQDGRSFQQRTLPAQFGDSPLDIRSSRRANTTNIDIDYQSPHNRAGQQYHEQPFSTQNSNLASSGQSVPMEGVQSELKATQDKENNESPGTKNSTRVNSSEDRQSPTVIPLPPPPEQAKTPKNDRSSSKKSQQQQQQEDSQQNFETQQNKQQEDEKKLKKLVGPTDIMAAIQEEVDALLKEIVSCSETSQDSKEYRRLDEFLTRCVLKLDNIDCGGMPDLRAQRKAIIARIDRCTDVLKRKISLNHDIQQLIATIPLKS